ncbi:hypothetical protein WAI453_001741 [Rhynchosporium graminicola]
MNSPSAPAVRLSCEECKRRKTKCNKQVPCTACKSAGIKCNTVQRARKPRGRIAQNKSSHGEIDTRVARLEDLVRQLKSQVQSGKGSENEQQDFNSPSSGNSLFKESNALQKYVASDFWEALSLEANGIREILEGGEDIDSLSEPAAESPVAFTDHTSSSGNVLFGYGTPSSVHDLTQLVTSETRRILLSAYQSRVDCIVKFLHWPSVLTAIVIKDAGQSGNESSRAQALESAICYTAVCIMTDEEAETSLGCKKALLRDQLRMSVEMSFSNAKLLEQPDLMVLQAFLIYLLGLKCSTTHASAWTLFSIAVRLAKALQLGSEDPSKYSALDMEIRRRVWSSIGVLDAQLALDRGAPAMLSSQDMQKSPLTINDSDLYPGCPTPIEPAGFTDMSFASMTHRASICQKAVEGIPSDTDDSWSRWKEAVATCDAYEEYARVYFANVDFSSPPLQQFAQAVADASLANIKLMLRRPPHRNQRRKIPPWDDFDVMKSATHILERALLKHASSTFNTWAWFSWVKWYVLAVLLAELCGPVKGSAADDAYVVAQKTFVRYARVVADSESGMLWRPIVKLMRRVQELRGGTMEGMSNPVPSPASASKEVASDNPEFVPRQFADLDINQQPLLQNVGIPFDQSFQNSNTMSYLVSGAQALESCANVQLDTLPDYNVPWTNWDNFLEDVDNTSNVDWSMDWQNFT